MRIIECRRFGCKGEVGHEPPISFLIIEDDIEGKAFACNICGGLYWGGGTPVRNRHGYQAFIVNKRGVLKSDDGQITGSFEVLCQ